MRHSINIVFARAHEMASACIRARTARSRFPTSRSAKYGAPGGARVLARHPCDEPLREVRPRAVTRAECESVSRGARVTQSMGLRSPPRGRCASRRSTSRAPKRWVAAAAFIPPRHERWKKHTGARNIINRGVCQGSLNDQWHFRPEAQII
jgi:hypothetical protein